jgi:error-prone DNA polymerase
LVICRQQPGTATGVTFYTLEDETGFVNLVVWRPTFEKYSVLARTAVFLGVTGKIQRESGVVHLIADSLFEPKLDVRPVGVTSRDFC